MLKLITTAVGFGNQEQALIIRLNQSSVKFFLAELIRSFQEQSVSPNFKGTYGFMDGFFKSSADGHNFSRSFHLCTKFAVGTDEFIERPTRDFANDIIECWFEAGICLAGYRVNNLIQRVTQRDLGGHFGNRVTCSFGGKG
ncbi:hypothetical protein D3C86_1590620 [compost metagenome]